MPSLLQKESADAPPPNEGASEGAGVRLPSAAINPIQTTLTEKQPSSVNLPEERFFGYSSTQLFGPGVINEPHPSCNISSQPHHQNINTGAAFSAQVCSSGLSNLPHNPEQPRPTPRRLFRRSVSYTGTLSTQTSFPSRGNVAAPRADLAGRHRRRTASAAASSLDVQNFGSGRDSAGAGVVSASNLRRASSSRIGKRQLARSVSFGAGQSLPLKEPGVSTAVVNRVRKVYRRTTSGISEKSIRCVVGDKGSEWGSLFERGAKSDSRETTRAGVRGAERIRSSSEPASSPSTRLLQVQVAVPSSQPSSPASSPSRHRHRASRLGASKVGPAPSTSESATLIKATETNPRTPPRHQNNIPALQSILALADLHISHPYDSQDEDGDITMASSNSDPRYMDIDLSRRNRRPRPISDAERNKLEEFVDAIHYSSRYSDDQFEYRHVQLPKQMLKLIPRELFDGSRGTLKLLWEDEWRALGITQSLGWEHYEVHEPEPHILLFKRPLNYQPPTH